MDRPQAPRKDDGILAVPGAVATVKVKPQANIRNSPLTALYLQADQLARADRFDKAKRLLLAAQSDDPALGLFKAGCQALHERNFLAAVQWFEHLLKAHPDFPLGAESLAGALRRDARYQDCLNLDGPDSRQMRYERAMARLALSQARQALDLFDTILDKDPDHAASWFASHAAALDLHGLDQALIRLNRANACQGANGRYWSFVAAYALLTDGQHADDLIHRHIAPFPARQALVDGIRTLRPHLAPDCRLFGLSAHTLSHAMACAANPGMILEFGVRRGTSIRHLATCTPGPVHGFDSFQGLPQDWLNRPAGLLSTGLELPDVPTNVELHPGWFQDSLPPFLAQHPGPVRLVNLDSDIYDSAKTVLSLLTPRLTPGTILVFDEMIGNRGWENDEYRAFMEFISATGHQWSITAMAPATKQVVIRLDI